MLCFIYGERKIGSTVKKSQNIMNVIVGKKLNRKKLKSKTHEAGLLLSLRSIFSLLLLLLLLLILLLLLLCHFIVFTQAVLNAEIFLLGELQLVAKGQEGAFTLHV